MKTCGSYSTPSFPRFSTRKVLMRALTIVTRHLLWPEEKIFDINKSLTNLKQL